MANKQEKGIVGRARGVSLSLLNATPQLGMWQATGTAIAQAPNLTELREPEIGGSNIEFDAHGHSILKAKADDDGGLTLVKTQTKTFSSPVEEAVVPEEADIQPERHHHKHHFHRRQSLKEKHASPQKEPWSLTVKNGLKAFWVFMLTPSGFLITIYGLNIVVRLSPSLSANQGLTTFSFNPLTHSGLGRNALLPPPEYRAGYVPRARHANLQLQRRLLPAQDLARNLLPDPQRLVLCHRLRSSALALPRLLLDGSERALPRPVCHAALVQPKQGLVSSANVVFGRRELEE